MAIIKAIKWKGFSPYWWIIGKKQIDVLNNKTLVTLYLYSDAETSIKTPNDFISEDIVYRIWMSGVDNTDDQIYQEIMDSDDGKKFFYDWVNVGNYLYIDNQSPIYIQISNDPISGVVRFAECISNKNLWRNNSVILTLRIYFAPDGINIDNSLSRDLIWIVDDYDIISGTNIGQYTYFNQLRLSGQTDEQVIMQGIGYGDQIGEINRKLYGNQIFQSNIPNVDSSTNDPSTG